MECFWIECCKTKTKVITEGQSEEKEKYLSEPIRFKVKTSKLPKAQENACVEVVIGFSFGSMWLVERVAASFLDQSQNEVKQTQRNLGSLSTLNWKLLYLMKQNNLFNFTISREQLLNNTVYN